MAAVDKFPFFKTILESPGKNAFSITPHDTNELAYVTRWLYIGGDGDVAVVLSGDTAAVTLKAVNGGTLLPLRVKKVLDTGTDDNMYLVGIY